MTAEGITPVTTNGETQIIHYDSGVGTGDHDHRRGGILGQGPIDKIDDAYTSL